VGILVCASNACTPEDGAQVLLAGLAAVDDALGHQLLLRIGNALLLRPLPALVKHRVLTSLAESELKRCEQAHQTLGHKQDLTPLRSIMEMWAADEKAKEDPELWLRWEDAERSAGEHKRASGVHWRALRTLEDADNYHRLRALDSKTVT